MHSTLTAALYDLAELDDVGFEFVAPNGALTYVSYAELLRRGLLCAQAFRKSGLNPGDRFGLITRRSLDFAVAFVGAVLAGIVPVPQFPPYSMGGTEAYLERVAAVTEAAGISQIYADADLLERLSLLAGLTSSPLGLNVIPTPTASSGGPPVLPPRRPCPDDVVYLQFTSGSTGVPKGVPVTHAMLVANVRGIERAVNVRPDDRGVSWLPLHHDMGLVGFLLSPLLIPRPVRLLSPMRFATHPGSWLESIHETRATVTQAPTFAFDVAVRRATQEQLARWDLSCLRLVGCGAEPIRADVLRRFSELFGERCGLRPEVITPMYGLAEATVAVTISSCESVMNVDTIDLDYLRDNGKARLRASGASTPTMDVVGCGQPIEGMEVRILRADASIAAEREQGAILVRGCSVAAAYYGAGKLPIANGWLSTGDLGYKVDGELYITGREKDLVILRGHNYHPQVIEWAAAGAEGVRRDGVVAFAEQGAATERLVVAVERDLAGVLDDTLLARVVQNKIRRALGFGAAQIVVLAPGRLPRTSSGKLRRCQTRDLYLRRELGNTTN